MNEQDITILLAGLLLILAGYFGWQQLRTLLGMPSPDVLGADDRRFLRIQAYRRLLCSVLLVAFAAFLFGWLLLEPSYRQVREEVREAQTADPGTRLTAEQKEYLQFFSFYWISALLVLTVLLGLAAMDFWATARYGLRQHRKLQADQKAILADHAARFQERNGQKGKGGVH